jgi:hypothetical protein
MGQWGMVRVVGVVWLSDRITESLASEHATREP